MTIRSPDAYSRSRAYRWRAYSYAIGEEALCSCGKTFVQLAAYQACWTCLERRRLPASKRGEGR